MTAQAHARAKINLYLHITGRRDDGYHLLDSMVVFAHDVYDTLAVETADNVSLNLSGVYADAVQAEDNLVIRAAALLAAQMKEHRGARIALDKQLPVGGGIGGGSADAAAALKLLNTLWKLYIGQEKLASLALELGADVPVCIHGEAARMQGIGEKVTPLVMPELHAVLVNPGIGVDTAQLFRQGIAPTARPVSAMELCEAMQSRNHLLAWLRMQHNTLEQYAVASTPDIKYVLDALSTQEGCELARMSGSGSTCFGIFSTQREAESTAQKLLYEHPNWWVRCSVLK